MKLLSFIHGFSVLIGTQKHVDNFQQEIAQKVDYVVTCDLALPLDESECQSTDNNYSSDNSSITDDNSDSETSCYLSDPEETAIPSKIAADKKDQREMTILSCFLRNNLSASSCRDILATMKTAFPDSRSLQETEYDQLWKHIDSDYATEIHYCENCCKIFPDDLAVNNCDSCNGLRYKGLTPRTGLQQPRASFVLANLTRQLKNLLQSPGMLYNSIFRLNPSSPAS